MARSLNELLAKCEEIRKTKYQPGEGFKIVYLPDADDEHRFMVGFYDEMHGKLVAYGSQLPEALQNWLRDWDFGKKGK